MAGYWIEIINTAGLFGRWSGFTGLEFDDVTTSSVKHHTHISGLAKIEENG